MRYFAAMAMGMPCTGLTPWAWSQSVFRGNFEGDVLTLTNPDPKAQCRAVFDFSKRGSYAFRMDVSPDGTQWFPFLEGQYRRQ